MNPPEIIRPQILNPFSDWLVCGMTTRTASGADGDRLAFGACIPALVGCPEAAVVVGSQVHGARLALATTGNGDAPIDWDHGRWPVVQIPQPEGLLEIKGVDGIVTANPGTLVGVFTADCVPVLLVDPARRMLAAVHAGREGTRLGIVGEAVRCCAALGATPDSLLAWIAPCISAPRYEITAEMARVFARCAGDATVGGPEGRHLDLREANRLALLAAGLLSSHIEVDPRCTYENPDLLYSYRRDAGLAGRMLTFALRTS